MAFKTLSQRVNEPTVLADGVPGHLRESLVSVVLSLCTHKYAFQRSTALLLERESGIGPMLKRDGLFADGIEERNFVENLRRYDPDDLLMIVDAAVRLDRNTADQIQRVLMEAGSIFEVRTIATPGGQKRALERRVSPELAALEETAGDQRVRRELAEARRAIFGPGPDFTKGLHHCVKAVEVAGLGIVEPNNSKATLGSMAGQLKNTPTAYAVTARSESGATVSTVEAMCRLLWDTERVHRHGTPETRAPAPPTQKEAEGAYALAVVLCDWFGRGVIARQPGQPAQPATPAEAPPAPTGT
jgi:hypothetical protein